MSISYVSPWMTAAEAIVYIKAATGCDDPQALAQLRAACRDGAVEGRGCGNTYTYLSRRGLMGSDADWLMCFANGEISAENCEFSREGVGYWFGQSLQQARKDAPAAVLQPFHESQAHALLIERRTRGGWAAAPTESAARDFLAQHFSGLPRNKIRKLIVRVWKTAAKRGSPKKTPVANSSSGKSQNS